ncbi:WbqC family protein [Mangrovimonas sp. CR14]|uniref:WbqC family protein n=1 Tax=Mangrovimonas sp. CR14 TaxID=2706120 RepID=UPI0014211536|nr:WbqC family protein [Mangrovimonas sp. CR14]
MTVGIMQPYVFPYLGYFQLIEAVDKFVVYDDVNFIKGGWINRNRILNSGQGRWFTIPIKSLSPNNLICETEINKALYPKFKKKFFKTLEQNYSKAPFFCSVYPIIEDVFNQDYDLISSLAGESIKAITKFLNISVTFETSSETYSKSRGMERTDRVINICLHNKAKSYINVSGGVDLYQKSDFKKNGIELSFLKHGLPKYKQYNDDFINGLSIIDALMFNDKDEVKSMLSQYTLF